MSCSIIKPIQEFECGTIIPPMTERITLYPYYKRENKIYCIDQDGNKCVAELNDGCYKITIRGTALF